MTTQLSNQLMRATFARLEANRQEALAIIELYLNSSVGVGTHPDLVTELVNATLRLSEAEEAISTLNRNFLSTPDTDESSDV